MTPRPLRSNRERQRPGHRPGVWPRAPCNSLPACQSSPALASGACAPGEAPRMGLDFSLTKVLSPESQLYLLQASRPGHDLSAKGPE